jgi:methionyl-tRNA formyltransferase
MLNFIFFGGKDIGNYILKNLINDKLNPVGIVAYRDIIDPQILNKCKKSGSKILHIESFKNSEQNIYDFILNINPNSFISSAFPFILSERIINLVNYPINIHTGALPKYRGHHPISFALLNDEKFQATTIHFMEKNVDEGRILLQDFVEVTNEDDINSIKKKLIIKSYILLKIIINQIKSDCIYPKKQFGETIWAPKRTPEDSKIEFSNSSRFLHNFIRALSFPYPNAYTELKNGTKIKIQKSISSNIPGLVLDKTINNRYVISTKDGVILIETDSNLEIGQII